MQQHRNESHVSQFTVVLHHRAAYSRHLVASIKAELCLGVFLLQRRHQVRSVQVARSLSCYEIILHL